MQQRVAPRWHASRPGPGVLRVRRLSRYLALWWRHHRSVGPSLLAAPKVRGRKHAVAVGTQGQNLPASTGLLRNPAKHFRIVSLSSADLVARSLARHLQPSPAHAALHRGRFSGANNAARQTTNGERRRQGGGAAPGPSALRRVERARGPSVLRRPWWLYLQGPRAPTRRCRGA